MTNKKFRIQNDKNKILLSTDSRKEVDDWFMKNAILSSRVGCDPFGNTVYEVKEAVDSNRFNNDFNSIFGAQL